MDANLSDVDPSVKRRPGQHHGDLRNVLLVAAAGLVREAGPRGFTMAEAARRAGVSVAAPYKHFRDRDSLLAALAEQGYRRQGVLFEAAMRSAPGAREQLVAVAVAYLDFAVQSQPLFEVMFGAGLDKSAHPDLAAAGAQVLAGLMPACEALEPDSPDELLVAVAALAHGHAVFLLEGALGRTDDVLPAVRQRLATYVAALLDARTRAPRRTSGRTTTGSSGGPTTPASASRQRSR